MPNFLVESYLADAPDALEEAREQACAVADERAGVRYVRTTFLPGDETILHVFAAPSIEALRDAAQRAALLQGRIVEIVERCASARGRDCNGT